MAVVILGLLAVLAFGALGLRETCRAAPETAKVQLRNLRDALALYAVKYEHPPSTEEGLAALTHPLGGRALVVKIPHDPWDRSYRYRAPGPDGAAFELRSDGPDQVPDTEDDLVVLGSRPHDP